MKFIIIYATYPNSEEAKKIAKDLLDKKLIACANFFPIESMCFWNGKIENSNEVVSILKTRNENWEKVKTQIKKLHSYEVPCIIKIEVEGNREYGEWVKKIVRPDGIEPSTSPV